mgnify:CR=1 FL=1
MSLKFELLQADDYSRYLLRGRTDILFNLRGMIQKRAMLSAFIDASADSFLTAIVALSPDENHLVLDAAEILVGSTTMDVLPITENTGTGSRSPACSCITEKSIVRPSMRGGVPVFKRPWGSFNSFKRADSEMAGGSPARPAE